MIMVNIILFQRWILMVVICASLVMNMWPIAECSSEADKIARLPGQPNVSFQQFGGYIFVDDKKHRALFYYFVEAKSNPASKPLILWLNGGPGCSSLGFGAFTEHGPFLTNYGEAIVKNKYSWNREANIIYLESPAGVGFSYSTDESFYSTLNDEITARDNLVFLHRWLAKYPEYKNRDFYIMGESYGGHYVPQLAELIVKSKKNFHLKGIAKLQIGNPLLDLETDYNARDEYFWSHGIVSDSAYQLRTSYCNSSRLFREALRDHVSPNCIAVIQQIQQEYSYIGSIDIYNVAADKCLSYNLTQASILTRWLTPLTLPKVDVQGVYYDEEVDECYEKKAETYLNRKDVQTALHARLVGPTKYRLCSSQVVNQYSRADQEIATINCVGRLLKCGIRVIVYSGDLDSAVPLVGTRRVVNALAKRLGLKTTLPYSAWFVGKQVAGWTQVYGDRLTFATVRGASHSTPTTQPRRSFILFHSFLHGKQLPKP